MDARKQAESAVAARIRALRQERGLRQADLARLVGVSRRQVIKYEAGQAVPSLWRAQALAAALSVPLADLLGDADAA